MGKTDEKAPRKIRTESDIQSIEWLVVTGTRGLIDTATMNIDFRDVPDSLRPELLSSLLTDGYERARRNGLTNTSHKPISQNSFALHNVRIDNQLYSAYKNMTRQPSGDNIDRLANYFGDVVYDILDVPRRIPKDWRLARIAEIWPRISEHSRSELLEKAENYLINKDAKPQE
ncbi:MAG TPA: hypothetical protein VN452_01010 [Longilinea sp.]|nr:hypothetical protein [Longilinea sp.]